MKKKYITRLPDQVGAFLRASEIISYLGGNIVRASYNRSVDVNTLFLDVQGTDEQIQNITEALEKNGYIAKDDVASKVMLLELKLVDKPGSILPVLRLVNTYKLSISYLSSTANGSEYQNFKIGLFVDNSNDVDLFLKSLSEICEFKIIDYDNTEKYLDNTVFYMSFAGKLSDQLGLDKKERNRLMVYSNMIIQRMDDAGNSVYKTFEIIAQFADMIASNKGTNFECRLSNIDLGNGAIMYVIEPACGSNTYVIQKDNKLLFIDCGFACYREEMQKVLEIMIPNFNDMPRELIITHTDIDHCGLADMFDRVYTTKTGYNNFLAENCARANVRESNVQHMPYCKISRIISGYQPPKMETIEVIGERADDDNSALAYIGALNLLGEKFDIYQGNGGHVPGEIVIVCDNLGVVFTGDIFVNPRGFTKSQYAFNLLAPYLLSSVNLSPKQARVEREELAKKFDLAKYYVCAGHGAVIPKGEYI